MRFEALTAVRDRLKSEAALLAYFIEHYPDTPLNFFIGAKLNPGAHEFPYIAVAPMTEEKAAYPSLERVPRLSIMYGVNDDAVDEGVYRGIRRVCEIGELILDALRKQPIGTQTDAVIWDGSAQTRSDAGIQHPYYEGETIIPLLMRV
jgi:hypothetical protein